MGAVSIETAGVMKYGIRAETVLRTLAAIFGNNYMFPGIFVGWMREFSAKGQTEAMPLILTGCKNITGRFFASTPFAGLKGRNMPARARGSHSDRRPGEIRKQNSSAESARQPYKKAFVAFMAQSLSKVYVHLVFSTKNREPLLSTEWLPDLWAYLAGAIEGQKCFANKIGGVNDHVHILFEQHKTVSLSNVVGGIKAESSKWVKREKNIRDFAWQAGYGAFSVSASNLAQVKTYIAQQESHHRTKTFQEEFRTFLSKYEVEYDERYVWD